MPKTEGLRKLLKRVDNIFERYKKKLMRLKNEALEKMTRLKKRKRLHNEGISTTRVNENLFIVTSQ